VDIGFYIIFWRLTHVVSKVEKLHTKYLFIKRTNLLLLSSSFLALFVYFYVVLLFVVVFLLSTCSFPIYCLGFQFFYFYKHFFATIHLYCVHFPHCWVCIVLLFIVVFFSFTCSFPLCCLGFRFFSFCKHFFATIHLFLKYKY